MKIPPVDLTKRFTALEAGRRSLSSNQALLVTVMPVTGGFVKGHLLEIGSGNSYLMLETEEGGRLGISEKFESHEMNQFIWEVVAARKHDLVLVA